MSFVGIASNDSDLLVMRAVRHLQEADIVVHDASLDLRILDFARRDAERLAIARVQALHIRSSANVANLLSERARSGKRVVRLHCGAAVAECQGDAEIDAILEMKIPFDVVQAPNLARL